MQSATQVSEHEVRHSSNEKIRGKIIKIKDGDTVELLDSLNIKHSVRLAHIDAPEKNQDYGTVSKNYLGELCFSKNVVAEKTDTDRNGRWIALIWEKEVNVNLEMVKAGMAWHYKAYSKDKSFANAENQARNSKLGLWSMSNPISPWDFRKSRKKPK